MQAFAGYACSGAASATVSVIGPTITSLFLFSQVTPGGTILLTGNNFGDNPGEILLDLTDINGKQMDVPVYNQSWGNTFASAGLHPKKINPLLRWTRVDYLHSSILTRIHQSVDAN